MLRVDFIDPHLFHRLGGILNMETTEIDWSDIFTQSEQVSLREVPFGEEYEVVFDRVFQNEDGTIGAEVTTDLPGTVLSLKGKFGPQNGLLSLMGAAGDADKIEGGAFTFSRLESDKNPAGYAYRWVKAST